MVYGSRLEIYNRPTYNILKRNLTKVKGHNFFLEYFGKVAVAYCV